MSEVNMFMNSVNAAVNSRVAGKYVCAGMSSEFLMHHGRRVPPFQEADNRKMENGKIKAGCIRIYPVYFLRLLPFLELEFIVMC